MKAITILMLLSALLSGCVYARVWHRTDSDTPTTEEEVQAALSQCEQTNEVATAHRHALTWRCIYIGTIWILYVNLATYITLDAIAGKYETNLITCMQKANFNCISYRTGRLKWDALSDFDISMEEWEKQKKK